MTRWPRSRTMRRPMVSAGACVIFAVRAGSLVIVPSVGVAVESVGQLKSREVP
jgi:hypothetical protein